MTPVLEGPGRPISSWVGSVWSLREAEQIVFGEVREVDGDQLTLAVVGVGNDAEDRADGSPSTGKSDQVVHLSTASLITHWARVTGARPGSWRRYRRMG